MLAKNQETIVVRTDTGAVSSNEKSGIAVFYDEDENIIVVKYPTHRIKSVRYASEYAIYRIIERTDAGLVRAFEVEDYISFAATQPKEGYEINF